MVFRFIFRILMLFLITGILLGLILAQFLSTFLENQQRYGEIKQLQNQGAFSGGTACIPFALVPRPCETGEKSIC